MSIRLRQCVSWPPITSCERPLKKPHDSDDYYTRLWHLRGLSVRSLLVVSGDKGLGDTVPWGWGGGGPGEEGRRGWG